MKRFRFTILAVCLVLIFLGWTDVSLFLRNSAPEPIAIEALEREGAPREWLRIEGGYLSLEEAISTSGTVELDALLVPLRSTPGDAAFRVLVETHDPRLLELFTEYNFKLDSVVARRAYLEEHAAEFRGRRDITGILTTGIIASGNRDQLMSLAKDIGMDVPEDVMFIAEAKEPDTFRGFFFLGVALLGLVKALLLWKKPA